MKTILYTVALFTIATVAMAVPEGQGWYLRHADEMHLEDLPIVDLEVTDDRFEGVTFHGTVDGVYKQMEELDPDVFANGTGTTLNPRSLEKREGSFNCGWGNTWTTRNNCDEGLTYLMRLDRAWCGVGAAPACARVSCSHQCGMFLCNKLNAPFRVSCGDIASDVFAIIDNCGNTVGLYRGARDFNTHFIGLSKESC